MILSKLAQNHQELVDIVDTEDDPLSQSCAVDFVQNVMAVNPLFPVEEKLNLVSTTAIIEQQRTIIQTPRKRPLSESENEEERTCQSKKNRIKGEVEQVRSELKIELDTMKEKYEQLDKSYSEIVKNGLSKKEEKDTSKVFIAVVKNLPCDKNENSHDTALRSRIETMVKDGLKLQNINIKSVERKSSYNEARPGIVVIEFGDLNSKQSVMKVKRVLRETVKYRSVYIENHIPYEKRLIDRNNYNLLKAVGKEEEFVSVSGHIKKRGTVNVNKNDSNDSYRKDNYNESYTQNYSRGSGYRQNGSTAKSNVSKRKTQNFNNNQRDQWCAPVRGVDNLPEREVIDFKANSYGEIFCEFLSNVNCCVLNGRNHLNNDYTYVSTRGSSVVDFCITPFENINSFKKFEVIRASDLANKSLTTGSIEPKYIPDHSVLCWEFESAVCENTNKQSLNSHDNRSNHIVYNVKNIPDTWMNDENSINLINSCIANIESCNGIQVELDNIYSEFINVIHNEMNDKLDKKIKIMNSVNNKKRRFKKRWWTDELTVKWNQVCLAEKQYLHCTKVNSNTYLRQIYVSKRKEFDKLAQQSKRQYWHICQEELVNLNKNDPRQFWRKIGNIGIGNDRQSKIPNEVLRSDGSVTNNMDDVLQKWKDSFHGLLNSDPDNNKNFGVENLIVKNDIFCNDLDDYISFDEVYKVAMAAKNGKSPGVDCIQAELCKNYAVIFTLTKLFNICFKFGKVPNMWNKGIITPIPKCSTTDPRDPLSYREEHKECQGSFIGYIFHVSFFALIYTLH
ncbi:unnamed protein product [Mytilus edulis]|uniref:Uncharacterized protein n=1 Tax=Mytilus edulis TaxID=6550 RepID=A0A8S3PSY3_MYTED|nr:unnamed protein product [Mytilus edulis]